MSEMSQTIRRATEIRADSSDNPIIETTDLLAVLRGRSAQAGASVAA
jgi:hypothetical protein